MDSASRDLSALTTLIIATRNAHKVQEIRAILSNEFRFLTLNDFPDAPHLIEDADTFAGNATNKAVQLARWLSRISSSASCGSSSPAFVLADDSGLEVDALGGAPGVHSARFATLDEHADSLSAAAFGNSPDAANNTKLLRLLKNVPPHKRTARFRCVLALTALSSETPVSASPVCCADELELCTQLFEGVCEGRIGFEPSGRGGFGYDPLFVPTGYDETFAELGEAVKNQLSHRAKALAKVREWFLRSAVK
jgi:XTP/dITP diphosphohydrolase